MLLDSARTDWLCSEPVFYNEKTGAISLNMNEVIDYNDFAIDAEGLREYLRFGYCVFGHTMVQNVRSLEPNCRISRNSDGKLSIERLSDPVDSLYSPGKINGSEVFAQIVDETRSWAEGVSQKSKSRIVLPLSGGLDSRLLAHSVNGMGEVRCFSYGLSARQSDSFEVIKASKSAKACNLSFEQIELDEFLQEGYLDKWFDLYGPSTHLHGMYQMEFYEKIMNKLHADSQVGLFPDEVTDVNAENIRAGLPGNIHMLSGIIGDGWAGTVRIPEIKDSRGLDALGYTHGMSLDENVCLLQSGDDYATDFYEKHHKELEDENIRIVYAMRFKMMLLNYLLKTPRSLGMIPWSPFTDPVIAMNIVNLDWTLKKDRRWQHEEFEKLSMDYGWEKSVCDYNIVIDIETLRKNPVRPLSEETFKGIIDGDFIKEVNSQIQRKPMRIMPARPKTAQNIYNKFAKKYNRDIDEAIIQYEILGSLERLLVKARAHGWKD